MTVDAPRDETARIRLTVNELTDELLRRVERRNVRRMEEIGNPPDLARRGIENTHYEFSGPGGTTFEHLDGNDALVTNASGDFAYLAILDLLMFFDHIAATPSIDTGSTAKVNPDDLDAPQDSGPSTTGLIHNLSIHYERLLNRLRGRQSIGYNDFDDIAFEGPERGIFLVPDVEPNEAPVVVLTPATAGAVVIPLADLLSWGRDYLATQQSV